MVFQLMQKLQDTTGSNAKKEIIKMNKDNKLFTDSLFFLLNPYIKTGISTKKINKDLSDEIMNNAPLLDLNGVMSHLKLNNTGKDSDVAIVQKYLETLDTQNKLIATEFLSKKLKLGVQAKTINSVVDIIPVFQPMLATEYSKGLKALQGKEFTLTLKLDGVRCVVIKDGDSITLYSRTGNEFEGIVEVERNYKLLPDGVYDGELIAIQQEGESTADLYRRSVGLANSKDDVEGLQHIVFDYVKLDDWYSNNSTETYYQRRENLKFIFTNEYEHIKLLPTLYSGSDLNMITAFLRDVSSKGFEGVMINANDSYYEFKRGKSLLKAKEFDSGDLKVLGVYEGQGRNAGKLGMVTVEYKGYEVGVGSGFTDQQREDFFNNPELIVGKIIRVDYQTESQDKDGNLSLRFPTFVDILDKTEVRYSDKESADER